MHHAWSRPYYDIDKGHMGRTFRLDTIRLYLSLSNLKILILQPRARLVWRACLIIISELWRREAVQSGDQTLRNSRTGRTRLGIRGLESRTQSARFDG
ncbi:hypothetical protein GB937_005308 [Aspergillus fischeri]|nr:hypothetical protein GB937_005308 [Aspergillus fischeri]